MDDRRRHNRSAAMTLFPNRALAAPLVAAAIAATAGSGALAQDAVDIPTPADPVAQTAFDILDRHCARCHQDGRLDNTPPKGDFGNVLFLDQIAANPAYVVSGSPDGSKLIQLIQNSEMPRDANYGLADPVSDDELASLRTWIAQLGETESAACAQRDFVTPVDMVAAMAADIDKLQSARVADTRYITLTHLYNACADDQEMEVYRQGTVKLLNSLSQVADPVRLTTIDDAGTIIRFNLKDLGWTTDDWRSVLASYPYAMRPDSQMFDLVASATFTPLPYVRGDWFAFTAAQPPLYDRLLKLPDTFQGLQAQLGVDVDAGINNFTAKRAGFQKSGVSRNNRLIERHTIASGYFWTSYDFAGNRARQSLFEHPLGPEGPDGFDHDGGETIYSLPNGFQAYYLNAADGAKLIKGPTDIVQDNTRRDPAVTNGISCMGCHADGMRFAKDDVREHVVNDRTFPRGVREAVEALYPTHDEMDALLTADKQRFQNAMLAAGLDPTLTYHDVEMINALANRYENALGLRLGAAEFGQDPDTFVASLGSAATADAIRLNKRLQQGGVVPRDSFENQFVHLVEFVSDHIAIDLTGIGGHAIPVATVHRPVEASRDFDLSLIASDLAYRVGDEVVFTARSDRDCYLQLVNVDSHGRASVIFPNQFQRDNFLPANRDLDVPSVSAPFLFRFADPGTETVIATCSLDNIQVDGVAVDYAQVFTDLGDYEQHVRKTRAIQVEARKPPVTSPTAVVPPDFNTAGVVARTAIRIEVR